MNRILTGTAALAIAVPAMAQMQPQPQPVAPIAPIAPRMDVTHTRDQVIARVRDHFARMDVNRDGFIAADEMKSMRGQLRGMRPEHGTRQAMRDPAKAFDRIDANRDGMISRDEFAKGREIRVERKVLIDGTPGAPGTGDQRVVRMIHRMGGPGGMDGIGGGMMKLADLDKDGRVSLQEATTSALQRFDRVDANRDGRITPEERRQNREFRRQSRTPKVG